MILIPNRIRCFQSCEVQDHKPTQAPWGSVGWERLALPTPRLLPRGIQMLENMGERDAEIEGDTRDKWSERAVLSKDIKSHWDSTVSTAVLWTARQPWVTLPIF